HPPTTILFPYTTLFRSATCPVVCAPAIKVYKQVVCYTNLCEPFSDDLNAQKTAAGVRVDSPLNCPAFCYRITVTNAGNVTLSNLDRKSTRLNSSHEWIS